MAGAARNRVLAGRHPPPWTACAFQTVQAAKPGTDRSSSRRPDGLLSPSNRLPIPTHAQRPSTTGLHPQLRNAAASPSQGQTWRLPALHHDFDTRLPCFARRGSIPQSINVRHLPFTGAEIRPDGRPQPASSQPVGSVLLCPHQRLSCSRDKAARISLCGHHLNPPPFSARALLILCPRPRNTRYWASVACLANDLVREEKDKERDRRRKGGETGGGGETCREKPSTSSPNPALPTTKAPRNSTAQGIPYPTAQSFKHSPFVPSTEDTRPVHLSRPGGA